MSEPWYANGLDFTCTRCGACCSGAPGFTWVSEDEIGALALRLGLDREAFCRRYTRRVMRGGRELVSLTEKPGRGGSDCVFWATGRGCTVYSDRPRQCRTWPFWRSNLRDGDDWELAARGCPGMGHGQHHSAQEVAAIAADDGLP